MKKIVFITAKKIIEKYPDQYDSEDYRIEDNHGNEMGLDNMVTNPVEFIIHERTYKHIIDYGKEICTDVKVDGIHDDDIDFYKFIMKYSKDIDLEDYISNMVFEVSDTNKSKPKKKGYLKYAIGFIFGVSLTSIVNKFRS